MPLGLTDEVKLKTSKAPVAIATRKSASCTCFHYAQCFCLRHDSPGCHRARGVPGACPEARPRARRRPPRARAGGGARPGTPAADRD